MTATIQNIPLAQLRLSEKNCRKVEASIDDLLASIPAVGLLQPLNVRAEEDGTFTVPAGGRRLRALQQLSETGQIAENMEVPCRVMNGEDDHEASLAENVIRQALHPADEYEAFAHLAENGMSEEDIALRFGIGVQRVKKRLRLGQMHPDVMALFRAGDIDMEVAMAFAATPDQERQQAVLERIREGDGFIRAWAVRRMLTEDAMRGDHKLALFVGEEDYEAQGGTITRDLFEDVSYFDDAGLVAQIASDKAAKEAVAIRDKEGWGWSAECVAGDVYGLPSEFVVAMHPETKPLTKAQEAKIDKAHARLDEIAELFETSEIEESMEDTLNAEADALRRKIEEIHEKGIVYPKEGRADFGVVAVRSYEGVEYRRGIARAEDMKAQTQPDDSAQAEPDEPKLSASLASDIDQCAAAAAGIALSEDVDAALDVMLSRLSVNFVYINGCKRPEFDVIARHDGIVAKARQKVQDAGLAGLAKMKRAEKLKLMAALWSEQVNQQRGYRDAARRTGLDVSQYWRPDETFFERTTTSYMAHTLSEAGENVTAKNKAEHVSQCVRALGPDAETVWLPDTVQRNWTLTDDSADE